MMLVLKKAELWSLVSNIKPLPVLKKVTDPNKIELKKKQITEYNMLNEKIAKR
jgi:hypothetical protein